MRSFDLPLLQYAPPDTVASSFGSEARLIEVSDPERSPGMWREYEFEGVFVLTRFYEERLVMAQFHFPTLIPSAAEALMLIGIDVSNAPPTVIAPAAKRWKGVIGGVIYEDVSAQNSKFDASNGYDIVQVNWALP